MGKSGGINRREFIKGASFFAMLGAVSPALLLKKAESLPAPTYTTIEELQPLPPLYFLEMNSAYVGQIYNVSQTHNTMAHVEALEGSGYKEFIHSFRQNEITIETDYTNKGYDALAEGFYSSEPQSFKVQIEGTVFEFQGCVISIQNVVDGEVATMEIVIEIEDNILVTC